LEWATVLRRIVETLQPGFEGVWAAAKPEELENDETRERMSAAITEAIGRVRELETLSEETKVVGASAEQKEA
jgi:hypothetical protein